MVKVGYQRDKKGTEMMENGERAMGDHRSGEICVSEAKTNFKIARGFGGIPWCVVVKIKFVYSRN